MKKITLPWKLEEQNTYQTDFTRHRVFSTADYCFPSDFIGMRYLTKTRILTRCFDCGSITQNLSQPQLFTVNQLLKVFSKPQIFSDKLLKNFTSTKDYSNSFLAILNWCKYVSKCKWYIQQIYSCFLYFCFIIVWNSDVINKTWATEFSTNGYLDTENQPPDSFTHITFNIARHRFHTNAKNLTLEHF